MDPSGLSGFLLRKIFLDKLVFMWYKVFCLREILLDRLINEEERVFEIFICLIPDL